MEMFNPAVAKERIGHLKKSSALDPLRDVERYFLKQAKKYKIDTSYDVLDHRIQSQKNLILPNTSPVILRTKSQISTRTGKQILNVTAM